MIITFFNFFNTTYHSVRAWYCIIIMTVLVLTYCDCCSYQATSSIVTLHNTTFDRHISNKYKQTNLEVVRNTEYIEWREQNRTEQNRTREK